MAIKAMKEGKKAGHEGKGRKEEDIIFSEWRHDMDFVALCRRLIL